MHSHFSKITKTFTPTINLNSFQILGKNRHKQDTVLQGDFRQNALTFFQNNKNLYPHRQSELVSDSRKEPTQTRYCFKTRFRFKFRVMMKRKKHASYIIMSQKKYLTTKKIPFFPLRIRKIGFLLKCKIVILIEYFN